jgi:hypothetical protein
MPDGKTEETFHSQQTWYTLFRMDAESSKFVGEVWKYKPVIILLVLGFIIIFCLSVIDTHRHRKKENKKRHKSKHQK